MTDHLKRGHLLFLCFFSLSCFSNDSLAASDPEQPLSFWEQLLASYSLDLGVAITQSKIAIKDASNTQVGELSSLSLPRPAFAISSANNYFSGSRFGYSFSFGFTWSTLSKQNVNGDIVDLGTTANAYSIYLLPVLGYTFGDRLISRGRGRNLTIGLGIGSGYLAASGRAQLADASDHRFNFNQLSVATLLVVDSRLNNWNLRLQVGGPNPSKDGFKYEIFDVVAQVAYSYRSDSFAPSSAPAAAPDGPPRWSGDLNLHAGIRNLPIIGNDLFLADKNKKSTQGLGLQADLRRPHWPVHLHLDLGFYQASDITGETTLFNTSSETVTLSGSFFEVQFGFRKIWNPWRRLHTQFGGGTTAFFVDLERQRQGVTTSDSAFDFGYWLGTGLFWRFKERYSVGLDLRLINVQTEVFEVIEEEPRGAARLTLGLKF